MELEQNGDEQRRILNFILMMSDHETNLDRNKMIATAQKAETPDG